MLKLCITHAKPRIIKNNATSASELPLESETCQGESATSNAVKRLIFLSLKIEKARKKTAKTVMLPKNAPTKRVASSVKPKSFTGSMVKI